MTGWALAETSTHYPIGKITGLAAVNRPADLQDTTLPLMEAGTEEELLVWNI
jgi:hypothetical protein